MNQDTASIVNAFLQKVGTHDAKGAGELFAEQIDWFVPLNSKLPWTGRRSKGSEVAEYLHIMWPYYETEKSEIVITKIFIDGDEAVIIGSFSHIIASSGRQFTTPIAMHLAIANGKIYKMHLYEDTFLVDRAFNH